MSYEEAQAASLPKFYHLNGAIYVVDVPLFREKSLSTVIGAHIMDHVLTRYRYHDGFSISGSNASCDSGYLDSYDVRVTLSFIKGPNLVKGIHLEGLRVLGNPEDFASFTTRAVSVTYLSRRSCQSVRADSLTEIISRTASVILLLTVGVIEN